MPCGVSITAAVAAVALLGAVPETPRGPPFRTSGLNRSVFRRPTEQPVALDPTVLRFLPASGQLGFTTTDDLCGVLAPADLVGNWWCVSGANTMRSGSAITFAPVGGATTTSAPVCPNGMNCDAAPMMNSGGTGYWNSSPAIRVPPADFTMCALYRDFNLTSGASFLAKFSTAVANNQAISVYDTSAGAVTTEARINDACVPGNNCDWTTGTAISLRAWNLYCTTYQFQAGNSLSLLTKVFVNGALGYQGNPKSPIQPALAATWTLGTRRPGADPVWSGQLRGAFVTETLLSDTRIADITKALLSPYTTADGKYGLTTIRTSVATCSDANGNVSFLPKTRPCITGSALSAWRNSTNYVLWSEAFENWTPTNVAVTPDSAVSPDGVQRADTLATTADGGCIDSAGVVISASVQSASVYVRSLSGTQSGTLVVRDVTSGTDKCSATFNATASWSRATCSSPLVSGSKTYVIRICPGGSASGAIQAWGAQFEPFADAPTPYIYTEATSAVRNIDVYRLTNPLPNGTDWCVAFTLQRATTESNVNISPFSIGSLPGNANTAMVIIGSTAAQLYVYDSADAAKTITWSTAGLNAPSTHRYRFCDAAGTLSMSVDSVARTVTTSGTGTGIITTMPTSLNIGATPSYAADGIVSDICVAKSASGCLQ